MERKQELGTLIRTEDSSYKEVSQRQANRDLIKLAEEIPFYSIKFEDYQNVQALVLHVALKGSQAQKSAMSKTFDAYATFAMPEIHPDGDRERALKTVEYLETEIAELCNEFGTTYTGDIGTMAYDIMSEFGGMTYLDCIKFFHNAKMGRYKNEMQHVSARGITREFLIDWLNKYLDQKETHRQALHKDMVEAKPKTTIEEAKKKADPELIKKIQAESDRKAKLRKEVEFRNKREDNLRRLVEMNITSVYSSEPEKATSELLAKFAKIWKRRYDEIYEGKPKYVEEVRDGKKVKLLNVPDYQDYISTMERRKYAEIAKAIKSVTDIDCCKHIVFKAYGTAEETNKEFNTNFTEDNFTHGLTQTIIKFREAISGTWYKHAQEQLDKGILPQEQKSWTTRTMRKFFIDRTTPENDVFFFITTPENE